MKKGVLVTEELNELVEERFRDLKIEKKKPDLTLDEQREQYGSVLWKREPNKCYEIRKVILLKEVLVSKNAWIPGLSREQSPTRAKTDFINEDKKFENIKICPLIHWTQDEIWSHIYKKRLTFNRLHEQGYPSKGCFPFTQAVLGGGDSREGRWIRTEKKECRLHIL